PQIAKVVVVRPGVWTNTLMLCTLSSYAVRNAHFSSVFMTMWISVTSLYPSLLQQLLHTWYDILCPFDEIIGCGYLTAPIWHANQPCRSTHGFINIDCGSRPAGVREQEFASLLFKVLLQMWIKERI